MRAASSRNAGFLAVAAAGALALGGCLSKPTSATVGPAPTADLAIKYVAPRYIEEDRFKRIAEYFDGQDHPGNRIILRTDPQQRAGFYFVVDLAWPSGVTLPAGTRVTLEYITTVDSKKQTADFTLTQPMSTWPELFLGLTGKAWPRRDIDLVAYKISIKDAEGKVLAEKPSFLWEMPAVTPAVAASAPDAKTTAPAKAGP